MSGTNVRRRQKKLEKNKKKRAAIQKDARRQAIELTGSSLLQKAREGAFGPAWVAAAIDDEAEVPALVTVIVTKRVAGLLLPQLVLVDRTCLGIKNATLLARMADVELREFVASLEPSVGVFRECEPLFAQSVVFHALDYAKNLGFLPHPDFRQALFEPRPDVLVSTPLAVPERPVYVSGPDDDVSSITARLDERVGASGYTFMIGATAAFGGAFDDEDELGLDLEEDDGEAEPETGTVVTEGTPLTGWTDRR